MTHQCPRCDAELSYEAPEPDVGIRGGYYCDACGVGYCSEDLADDIDHDDVL